MTLREIAERIGARLAADSVGDVILTGVASLAEATEGDISFFVNPKYAATLRKTRASAVIVPEGFADSEVTTACLYAADPAESFARVLELFAPPPVSYPPDIHPQAIVSEQAIIGQNVHIGAGVIIEAGVTIGDSCIICPGAYIGEGSTLGDSCHIHPRATILHHSRLGNRVVIHSGVVIGSDGFGYESSPAGHKKIPQTGIVQIDDDVEVGANSTIDRARFGRTWIGRGTKIDNLCQIGHNVVIGEHSILCGLAGISGSARIGSWVILAGQVGVSGHIEIADGAIVGPQAGVPKSIPPGGKFLGSPARPIREFTEAVVRVYNLKKTEARLAALEKRIPV